MTHKRLENLIEAVELLRPLLIGARSLEEDAELIWRLINGDLPLVRVSLVWLSQRLELEAFASFGGGEEEQAAVRSWMEERLPDLLGRALARNMDDGLCLETSAQEGAASFGPTATYSVCHEGTPLGFVVYEKEASAGAWTQEEKAALRLFAAVLTASFTNRLYNRDYRLQSFVFNSMMDSMRANIYVTDVKTDRILFMNKTMKETFGIEDAEGKICWQALQKDMPGRCAFCPVDSLQKGGEKTRSMVWEEENTLTGRIYENYDSLMRWTDGRLVHFQQSIDITERKVLERVASTDDLTGMLTRRAGLERLGHVLEEAKEGRFPVSVCMYDVNELKDVNDLYGHAEGDTLLRTIAEGVRSILGPEDYACRLSGDEFIVVFVRCTEEEAARKIEAVRESLTQEARKRNKPYELGFCFGIVETGSGDPLTSREILSLADEKMYAQKRSFHIRRAEEALAQGNAGRTGTKEVFSYETDYLYDALVRSTDDYIYVCDMKTGAFRYPKSMVEEFGLPGEIVQNAAAVMASKVHEKDKQIFLESNQEIADGRTDSHNVEYRIQNVKGEWVWLRCRGHLERDKAGKPALFAGIITNLGKKNKVDHVTGLLNKFECEEEIQRLIQRRPQEALGVMLLGMDEFKRVNDLYDRVFGDEVLRATAQRIQTLLPADATLYRLDGDEFCVLLRSGGEEELRRVYDAIHAAFDHQQEYNGQKYHCTLSAGCALYPQDADNYLELNKCASSALDYAKAGGRNRMSFFFRALLERKSRALELTELLRESVEQDFSGFELYYQPQVDARSGSVVGAEALARWRCEKHGPVGPDEFIPLLEGSGLIHTFGRWVIRTAAAACGGWAARIPAFTVSVNLSHLQLAQPDLLPFLQQVVTETGLLPGNMVVELTESCVASNIDTLKERFEQIRSMGIRVAMDDFGTGYSSLGILKKSPADIVKIDRAFVQGIRESAFDATFIRFIVALCRDVAISVCLEGVETEEEYKIVRDMGVDCIQGYYFGRPVPAAELEERVPALAGPAGAHL